MFGRYAGKLRLGDRAGLDTSQDAADRASGSLTASLSTGGGTDFRFDNPALLAFPPAEQGLDVPPPVSSAAVAMPLVLYLQEQGDTAPVSIDDVNQGQIGDCFLLAAVGELALYHPTVITNMIRVNADGTETVSLYLGADGKLPALGATGFKLTSITVDNTFPSNSVNNGAAQDVVGGQKEIWVQVLEKAIATLDGGYSVINQGGWPYIAMEELTGCTATTMYSASSLTFAQLQSDVAAGDLITMDTAASSTLPYSLVGDHAYMLEGVSMVNGVAMAKLGNPWGYDSPPLIPLSELTSSGIDEVDILNWPATPTPLPSNEIVLHGSSSQYIIADSGGSLYIQDTVSGRDGTKTLSGVDEIRFTDKVGVFDPAGSAEDISRLYPALLGRAADAAGLEYWAAQMDDLHVPLSAIASGFAASPEFIQHYGSSVSDSAFVNLLYQNVLGRTADASGAHYWEGVMAGGVGRGSVAQSFAESPENMAGTLSTAGNVNSAEAYRLYVAALNRKPDASGLTFWSGQLTGGVTPAQVAASFIVSPEFQQDYGTLGPSDFVATLYKNVLHRSADQSGLQYWTNSMQGGESRADVLLGFSDSLENRINTAGATHANWVLVSA